MSEHDEKQRVEMEEKARELFPNAEITSDIGDIEKNDAIMVCTRAEEYEPWMNGYWVDDENKSYPRDLHCAKCGWQVVMSNKLFKVYQEKPRPESLWCGTCAKEEMEK